MHVTKTRQELTDQLSHHRKKKNSIGFVPTMGALHEGHISLVRAALENHPIIVVSIFVNPRQFNNPEDLRKYPRVPDQDLNRLGAVLRPSDLVFIPDEEAVYTDPQPREFNLDPLDRILEGRFRPGHFQGVADVVSRFFDLIHPDKAYFGRKDLQQVAVIRKLCETVPYHVQIVSCPILREDNGLAMSSRNILLPQHIREKAGVVFRTLLEAKNRLNTLSLQQIKEFVCSEIEAAGPFSVEYFEIVHEHTFRQLQQWGDVEVEQNYYGCIAVYAGKVRLIDNMLMIGRVNR